MPRDKTIAEFRAIQRADAQDMTALTIELARRYLALDPKRGVVWLYYADSLRAKARYAEALSALRRARRLCPPHKLQLVYCRFGHLHKQRGAFRLAENWYRRAVKSSPSDATYRIFLGGVLALAGRLPEAEAVHRQATRCKEGCIDEAYLNLGLVLCAIERYSEARKCFKRALVIDPKYKDARKELLDVERVIELHRKSKRGGSKL